MYTERDVGFCGLLCAQCGAYRKGRCPGCKAGGGFKGCKVRNCAKERGYDTCASCPESESCRKLDNFVSRLFGWFFGTDRMGNLREIREQGLDGFLETRSRQTGEHR